MFDLLQELNKATEVTTKSLSLCTLCYNIIHNYNHETNVHRTILSITVGHIHHGLAIHINNFWIKHPHSIEDNIIIVMD